MNFSIHLPQPLLVNLDQFAKSHNISRSGVVREAVESYLAQKAGSRWPDLRRRGLPMGPYDLLIAATAQEHGLTMVTHNTEEFNRVGGLRLEDWQA